MQALPISFVEKTLIKKTRAALPAASAGKAALFMKSPAFTFPGKRRPYGSASGRQGRCRAQPDPRRRPPPW